MAKLDVVKEQINYLKVWLGIFVVTLIGLIGWFASNYESMRGIKLVLTVSAILFLVVSIHVLNKSIVAKIKSLEEL